MRCIDADALIEFIENRYDITWKDDYEGGIKDACVDILEEINKIPTIEPRKKGHWIRHPEQRNIFNGKTIECSECHEKYTVQYVEDELFCRHCGADMRTPVEIARNIVHEAIDNSVWSDTVDTAKMHKVVDDKYAEMTKKTEESKRCDTCKHEKERWFSRCADCSDYELWEMNDG